MTDDLTDDPTLLVEAAMTPEQKAAFLDQMNRLNPNWRGATVADFLAVLDDADARLDVIEPLFAEHGWYVPEPGLLTAAAYAAIYSASEPVTPGSVWPVATEIIARVRGRAAGTL